MIQFARNFRSYVILFLFAGYVGACSHNFNPPSQLPPAEQSAPITPAAKETKGKVEAIQPPLAAATQKARQLTPANVEAEKPTLVDYLNKSWAATLAAIKSAKDLEVKADASDKANAASFARERKKDEALAKASETIEQQNGVIGDLKQKLADYQKNVVTWVLRGMLVLCGLATMGGIYLLVKMDFWNGGALVATGIGGGCLFIFGIRLQDEIVWGVGIALALALVVFAYLAYRRLHEGGASIVKGFQALIATGKIDLAEVAPVLNAIQTKYGKILVDRNTPKGDQPNHSPNLNADANGPTSGAWVMPGGA